MSIVVINEFFLWLMVAALIMSVIDKKVKQPCLIDLLAVICAVLGVSLIATGLHYTIESTAFTIAISTWIVVHVARKIARARKSEL